MGVVMSKMTKKCLFGGAKPLEVAEILAKTYATQ
jgi:hypothetical protein